MRPILLMAGNYVRMQWVTLLVMTLYLVGISGVFSLHQQQQDVLFFLRSQPLYVLFISLMLAVPAIQTDRKSRRLLAVLSKGIHRWQYLGGILCGCAVMAAVFTLLIWAAAYRLCIRGDDPTQGLGLLAAALFACCVAASSAGLLYSTFLHPLVATGAAAATLILPLAFAGGGTDAGSAKLLFPVAGLVDTLVHYEFGGFNGLWALIVSATVSAVIFWILGAAIFARRDVTISPE
jgi:ABC-type transport system involved in multi-copper enzyme maturation permease subunit